MSEPEDHMSLLKEIRDLLRQILEELLDWRSERRTGRMD